MKSIVPASVRIAFWSLIGRMWDEQAPTRPHIERVVEIVQSLLPDSQSRILDVGCGAGVYSVAFAESGYDVTGVDAAQGMLSRARAKITPALSSRLRFGEENLDRHLTLPPSSFDGVIAISVLQAVQSPAHAGREVLRVLKPGGVFVVLHFLRPDYYDNSLCDQVRTRIRILKRKTPWNMVLTAVKIMAERANSSLYWSVDELHELLRSQGFRIESTPETNPIIVVARKPNSL
jgi:ubiquinone/menaquinone biosynthesis C-methylase UbiE